MSSGRGEAKNIPGGGGRTWPPPPFTANERQEAGRDARPLPFTFPRKFCSYGMSILALLKRSLGAPWREHQPCS